MDTRKCETEKRNEANSRGKIDLKHGIQAGNCKTKESTQTNSRRKREYRNTKRIG